MDSFALDKANAKVMGVCSGLARATDYNVLVIRLIGLLGLMLLGPITIVAYILTGWLAAKA